MFARILSSLIALILGVALSNRPSFAQISGDLEIKVTDSSAAVIPGATVTVRSRDTGAPSPPGRQLIWSRDGAHTTGS